jgi:hypothetical protein
MGRMGDSTGVLSAERPVADEEAVRRRRSRSDVWAAVAAGCAATILVLIHLLVPTTIGTADTGDQRRLLCQINAGDPHFGEATSSKGRFAAVTFDPVPPNPVACGAYRVTERYPSSALGVLVVAQQLTHAVGLPGALDIRMVGLVYALLFGAVIAMFVLVLPGPRLARLAVAGALAVLGSDATFTPYFNSAFSEPMEFVGLLATFASLLLLWRRRTASPWLVAGVTVVFAAMITAKSQDIPLCVLLALALLSVRVPIGRWTGRFSGRVVPAVAALALLGLGATDLYLQPKLYNEQLVYTDVFYTILKDSPDVPADLAELGLPAELSRYAGRTWFETRAEHATDPNYATFLKEITFSDIARFYAEHPARLGPVTRTGVEDVVRARHVLPNTTRESSTRPHAVCRICIIPPVGSALAPAGVVLWPLWELTVLVVGLLLVRRRWRDPAWRALGLVLVTSVGFALFHTATAILGDGYAELSKHVFPAVVDTWMVVPLVALGVAGLVRERSRRRAAPAPS